MAEFTGILCPGDITTVHSRTVIALGTRAQDTSGNEYIFLIGVASTVAGSWVTYDEAYLTTLLAANAKGPVAVAMSATSTTGKYGWYQIYGTVVDAKANYLGYGTLDDDDVVGRTGADGYVGDGPAAGDVIYGCICRSAMADGNAQEKATFTINYPYVDDGTAGH